MLSRILQQLEELYATIPSTGCKGLCQAYCGAILMTPLEFVRLRTAVGRPILNEELICGALDRETGRCTQYQRRPLICRLWGATPLLPCPHGCTPERMLTEHEMILLHAAVTQLSNLSGMKRRAEGFSDFVPLEEVAQSLKAMRDLPDGGVVVELQDNTPSIREAVKKREAQRKKCRRGK